MKATNLFNTRIDYSAGRFAEFVLWRVPQPVRPCFHNYKYRLAYVVHDVCVLRYDNEAGKGDHCHYDGQQSSYFFQTRNG